MPKPRPRPLECIHQAWHSDTHQALRGTLIHEIFRLVNELHDTSIRRKKEWQEKLPIVVLRAEEILYSKANSEGEYANVETLRNRLDDAVNSMIRREDSEEEGVCLVPCVEAALSLGCTPKRGTRGQRHESSQHLPNAARQASPTATPAVNTDCYATTTSMDSLCTNRDENFNLISSQVLPLQEQDFCMVSQSLNASLFSPVDTFQGPATCCYSNPSFIPLQNPTFYKASDVLHPAWISLCPKPGALVQFSSRNDACRLSGSAYPEALYALPQACFNVNQELRPLQLLDSAESSGARMDSRLTSGDESACAPDNTPFCAISGLPQDGSRETCDHQDKPIHGAVTASSLESVSCVAVKNAHPSLDRGLNSQLKEFLSLPHAAHGNSMLVLPDWCKNYKTTISQRKISGALFGEDDNSTSCTDAHDLQLRLGPAVSKPFATSDDVSAPKRRRVDAIDPSHTQIQ